LSDRPRELFHSVVRKTSNKRPTYSGQTRCSTGQPSAMYRLMQRSKKNAVLLDHLVSEERWWDGQTERLGRLEHQLKVGRPLTKAASMSLALLALSNSNCWLMA
jgi:hypothetical protein